MLQKSKSASIWNCVNLFQISEKQITGVTSNSSSSINMYIVTTSPLKLTNPPNSYHLQIGTYKHPSTSGLAAALQPGGQGKVRIQYFKNVMHSQLEHVHMFLQCAGFSWQWLISRSKFSVKDFVVLQKHSTNTFCILRHSIVWWIKAITSNGSI
jgi:hypothetical protein